MPKFEQAYRLQKEPRTAAQLGLCLQALSRWSEADPLLAEALSASWDPWVKKNRDILKESQEAVKAKVGRLEVLGDPEGALVIIGGRTVGALPLAGPVVVNEGSVDIELAREGYKRGSRTIAVAGASYQRIVLRLEPIGPPMLPAPISEAPRSEKTMHGPPQDEEKSGLSGPLILVGAGLAVAGAVVLTSILLNSSSGKEYDARRTIP